MTTITKKIECIGDDCIQWLKQYEKFERTFFPYSSASRTKERAWVAIIKDYNHGKFIREFSRGYKDYSETNSKGSRGVYKYYYLEEGPIYEVSQPMSWKNTLRYFCRVEDGEEIEMSKEEAIAYIEKTKTLEACINKHAQEVMTEEEYLAWLKKGI